MFLFPPYAHSIPPGTPRFFYNNIAQHPYCAGYTSADDDDSIECDGAIAGGMQHDGLGTSYLWKANTMDVLCAGCVENLVDSTPTLWFNVVDEDGAGEELWCELEISGEQQFAVPAIRYRSERLTIQSGNSVDWEYTVGQETHCSGDDCGYYDIGGASTALPSYGAALNYYWRTRACDSLDPATGLCDPLMAGPWLCSGGGDCGIDGDDADSNPWNNEIAFSYAPYFINADDADTYYETVGAVTGTSAQIVVATPYELDSFSIEYGTTLSYGDETVPRTNVTGAIKTDLTGLSPDTIYHYRITWMENGVSLNGRDRTFRTARNRGSPFTFVVTADTHWLKAADYYDKMVGILKPVLESAGADFWVDLGDFVEADIGVYWTQDHAHALYTRALWGINPIAHSLPFIPVVGNHEMINQYYGTDGCPFGAGLLDIRCQDVTGIRYGTPLSEYQGSARAAFFPLYSHGIASLDPDYKTFFAWEWGDALCIALDPYLYTTEYPTRCDGTKPVFTLGEAQKNWLLDLLRNDNHTWVFIFMHQHGGQSPRTQFFDAGGKKVEECYGRGGAATVPYAIQLEEWIRSAADHDNIIVFLSHDHVFSAGTFEGVRFFTCPTPTTWWYWPSDELGYRGEDWIYHEEETFTATVDLIDVQLGRIYVSHCTLPPAASDVYRHFAVGVLRNYGQPGNPKRLQRYIKKIRAADPDNSFQNGFVGSEHAGYLYVSKDGDSAIDHLMQAWKPGDRIYAHMAASGIVAVDVTEREAVVRMLDTQGKQVVYPGLYDRAGKDVAFTICSRKYDVDGDAICDTNDNCITVPNEGQSDLYPPGGNGCGDACECEGDFDGDSDVDGSDASAFKTDFGRSVLHKRCFTGDSCNGDFACDGNVDGTDALMFKQDFARNAFQNPCTHCSTAPWCNYLK